MWRKLGLLSSLYFAQGLPYGFFTQALPVLMRKEGMSLTAVGLSSLLALPWALKVLWAGFVDAHRGSPLGPRRGWILPLQGAAIVGVTALAFFRDAGSTSQGALWALAGAVVVTNLLSATQDIATDGLAVDILDAHERGHGNGVQVGAYRLGMIVGGGFLVMLFDVAGWRLPFLAMAALLAVATLPILLYREAPHATTATTARTATTAATEGASDARHDEPVRWWAVVHFFRRRHMVLWLLFLVAYKFGDAVGSPMARLMLVDQGWSMSDLGLLLGTGGSIAGLIGAMCGGWLAARGRLFALLSAGLVHAGLMASYAWPAYAHLSSSIIAALIVVEHVTGGMATVALFTAMMDACDKRTGASDYTTQASVVVLASGLGASLSGVSADALGYGGHFLVAGALCAGGSLAAIAMWRGGYAPPDVLPAAPALPVAGVASSSTIAVPTGMADPTRKAP